MAALAKALAAVRHRFEVSTPPAGNCDPLVGGEGICQLGQRFAVNKLLFSLI
jgi:hypothetical protein